MSDLEHLVACQNKLGEGPVWHPREQALYWVDIALGELHRYDPRSGACQCTELGMVVSAMGLRAGGGLVMATIKGFAFYDPQTASFDFIGDPDPAENGETRFNDGKTDPQGRFWAGKMCDDPVNSLFRLDPDRTIHRMESGICISNGLGWSPDHSTFYYTDSLTRMIYAYDYEAQSGAIHNRRVFDHVSEGGGLPDGLAIDTQGYIWSARWGGWKVVRYTPDGRVEREVPMPVEFPTSCAFGGENLDELYITSAWIEVPPDRRAAQPLAGDLFRLRVDVPGLPEPFFAG